MKIIQKKEYPDFEKIKKLIMNEMPIINIIDVIIDVENLLNPSAHFKPLSGNGVRITDYPSRFVATSLSYCCNYGTNPNRTVFIKIYSQSKSHEFSIIMSLN